jgi:YVTN family beta-propeller protein
VQTAVTPDGKYVFASLYDTREVVRLNLQTQALDRLTLPAGAQGPIQLYPTPDSKQLYVCDQGVELGRPLSDKVYVLDTESFALSHTITAGRGPHGVVVSRDGRHAFVTNSREATVSVIDVVKEKVVKTIKVGLMPNGISYRSDAGGMP